MSFLGTVGLITHEAADEAAMERWERRADVLSVLSPLSCISDSDSDKGSSSEGEKASRLIPLMAPASGGPSRRSVEAEEKLCQQPDYPHKTRFLQQIGLQPMQQNVNKKKG